MAITRSVAEKEIYDRLGPLLEEFGKGNNDDFNSPLRRSLRRLGLSASSPVQDSDFSTLTTANEEPFYDLCHYYTLEMLLDANTDVDWKAGPRSESANQLAERLSDALSRKGNQIENEHNIDLGGTKTAKVRVIEPNAA